MLHKSPCSPLSENSCGQGATFVNQYIVVKTLGRGAYGKVKLCLDSQDHELYAIKIINNAHGRRKTRALSKNRCVPAPQRGMQHLCGTLPSRTLADNQGWHLFTCCRGGRQMDVGSTDAFRKVLCWPVHL